MKILISNDDGYFAPGIKALADALSACAEVVVVAPDSNRSGVSNALTLEKPIAVQRVEERVYAVNGTPSDCVHIALTALLPAPPDLIVSGINNGQNMGEDTLYSGTVAAATEGYLFGVPAIAFSQVERGWAHLDAAARVAREIILRRVEQCNEPYLLNVNIPCQPYASMRGIRVTRLGKRHSSEPVLHRQDPFGRDLYWIGPPGKVKDAGQGTDFAAVAEGYVSVTPLQIDLTHHELAQTLDLGME